MQIQLSKNLMNIKMRNRDTLLISICIIQQQTISEQTQSDISWRK